MVRNNGTSFTKRQEIDLGAKILRSASLFSSVLLSLLFMKGNFLENEKFFFFRSSVDAWNGHQQNSNNDTSNHKDIHLFHKNSNDDQLTRPSLALFFPWNLTHFSLAFSFLSTL